MDWKTLFKNAETLMVDLKSKDDGNLEATWVKTEKLYQAFKQRLLEETTAIPREGEKS